MFSLFKNLFLQLHEEINRLKEENAQLTEIASHADYFASILKVHSNVTLAGSCASREI